MSLPQILYLITPGWKTGKDHRLEIWFVEYNEKYYIISEHLDKAHWIQNIKHNPRIKFSIYAEVLEGSTNTSWNGFTEFKFAKC